jgi:hypothetical protein
MKFEIGNRIRVRNTAWEGNIISRDNSFSPVVWLIKFDNGVTSSYYEDSLELISNKTQMNLKEQFASVFKAEPQKSFNKAGLTDSSDVLTSDGQAIFLSWLLKTNGDTFKTEVVDPILAEQTK